MCEGERDREKEDEVTNKQIQQTMLISNNRITSSPFKILESSNFTFSTLLKSGGVKHFQPRYGRPLTFISCLFPVSLGHVNRQRRHRLSQTRGRPREKPGWRKRYVRAGEPRVQQSHTNWS